MQQEEEKGGGKKSSPLPRSYCFVIALFCFVSAVRVDAKTWIYFLEMDQMASDNQNT